jgi:hypothetical protein
MSSLFTKLLSWCGILMLFCVTEINAQQDCNATSVSMSCNNLVNYSFGTSCTQQILPQDLLTANSFSCYTHFTVSILNTNLGNTITAAQIGKTYDVRVTHTITGNSCWGKIKVEDKKAPEIACKTTPTNVTCSDTTFKISNAQRIVFDNIPNNGIADRDITVSYRPTVVENCSGFTLSYNDNVLSQNCTDNGIISIVTRTWRAIDAQGNVATCQEIYHIVPERISSINIPDDITLNCGSNFALDAAGNPSPTITGYPKLKGITLDGSNSNGCQIAVGYQDKKIAGACGGYTLVRKWTITNWCEEIAGDFEPHTIQREQLIHVKDLQKPTFLAWNVPSIYPTDHNRCYISTLAPPVPQTKDNCDTNLDFFYELYDLTRTTLIAKGTTLKNIQPGQFILIARASDDCGNSDTISTQITVRDVTPPVAACDQNTKVALSVDGTAMVNATTFDDGSNDNCCLDTLLFVVKRMSEDDSQFRKVIKFDCNDATVQVVLRVADCNGNTNTCMVNALIEDKLPPVIFTQDGDVTCGGEPAARQWLDDNKPQLKTLNTYPSASNPGYYDNCGATLTFVDIIGIDQCSKGTIKRVWTATDKNGRTATAIQTVEAHNRSSYTIEYPKDVTLNCGTQNLDISTTALGTPKIVQAANSCAIPTVTYEDKVVGSGACYKIIRIWKVLNICQQSMTIAPNVYDEGMQNIHIIDRIAPTIGLVNIETIDEPKQCYAAKVILTTDGITDNCAKDVVVSYTSTIPGYEAGFLPATLLNVPFGKYTFMYRATDNCGNFSTKTFEVAIKDGIKPTPVCHDNLALSLGANGQAMLMARQVDAGSFDNCSAGNKLKFRVQVPAPTQGTAFDITKTDTMYTFFCPSNKPVGDTSTFTTYTIGLWVGDESDNWDYCETVVVVQDNMKMCPAISTKSIAGSIISLDNKPMEKVTIALSGNGLMTAQTDINGAFSFNNLPANGNYELSVEKNDFPLNGVSTYDLVLITKHILGVNPFQLPTQYIAADVNKSGTVTAADIVELRKMVLGIQAGFSKNTSWRFIERNNSYSVANVTSWLANLPNKKAYFGLATIPAADFTAVKTGDINASANANPRSNHPLIISADIEEAQADDIITLTFGANAMENIEGYQLALHYDKANLELLHIHGDKEAFAVLENGIITHNQIGNVLNENQLFGLTFRAKQKVNLKQAIGIDESYLEAEAYQASGEIRPIVLNFKAITTPNEEAFEVFQNQPNPFNYSTMIGFYLPKAAPVKLKIYDISGRLVKQIENDFEVGHGYFNINRNELINNGLYYYSVETPDHAATRKMLMIE